MVGLRYARPTSDAKATMDLYSTPREGLSKNPPPNYKSWENEDTPNSGPAAIATST
jgi:hypothetical protein